MPYADLQAQFLLLLRQLEYVRMIRNLRKHSLGSGNIPQLEDYQLPDSIKNKGKLSSCKRSPSKRKIHQNVRSHNKSVSEQLIGLEKMFLKSEESDTKQLAYKEISDVVCSGKVTRSQKRTCSMKEQTQNKLLASAKRHCGRGSKMELLSDSSSGITECKFFSASTPKVLVRAPSEMSDRKKRDGIVMKLVHPVDGWGKSDGDVKVHEQSSVSHVDNFTGTPLEELSKSSHSAEIGLSFDIQDSTIPSGNNCRTAATVLPESTLDEDCRTAATVLPESTLDENFKCKNSSENASSTCRVPDTDHEGSRQRSSDRELFDPHLDIDMCSSVAQTSKDNGMEDSDDELINFTGLTPDKVEKPVEAGDVVWAKWKNFPFLPAYVKTMNKKTKRLTLVMFGPKEKPMEKFPMSYSAKTVVPFYGSRRQEFVAAGQSLAGKERSDFVACMDRVEDYLLMKALDRLQDDMSFFHDDTLVLAGKVEGVGQLDAPEVDERERDAADSNAGNTEEKHTLTSPSGSQDKGRRHKEPMELSKRGLIMVQKRTEKSQQLCDFLLSDEVKDYLEQIFNKSVPSELHNTFVQGSLQQRAKIRYQGFGPIDDEDQMESLVSTYIGWLMHKMPEFQLVGYICDVWVPEAIVYGLRKLRGYCKKKAWEMFYKGVRRTKEELEIVHQEFLAKMQHRRSPAQMKK